MADALRVRDQKHGAIQSPKSTPKNTDKSAWGPQLWHSIHMIALNYPDRPSASDKLNYKLFYESLKDVIPCLACADNYNEHLQDLPIDRYLDSAGSLFAWTVHLHNIVNEVHSKSKWTVEEALAHYASYSASAATWSSPASGKAPSDARSAGDNVVKPLPLPRFHAAKDMLATWLILLVTGLIAICILLLSWHAWAYVRSAIAKKR